MVSSILLLFTNPDGSFRRYPGDWSELKIPAAIMPIVETLSTITRYLIRRVPSGAFPEGMQGVFS